MQPVPDNIRKGLLKVLADVLIYARSWAASPNGITPEQSSELNKLLNITHNIPAFIDGSYMLGFDEAWFTAALKRFDQTNRTSFAQVYATARASTDAPGVTHFKLMAAFVESLVPSHAQLREHHYHDDSFGSWWLLVRRHHVDFRIVFDGKDSAYELDRVLPGHPPGFETIWSGQGPREMVPQDLVDALRRAG
jgi:hypothetical protein